MVKNSCFLYYFILWREIQTQQGSYQHTACFLTWFRFQHEIFISEEIQTKSAPQTPTTPSIVITEHFNNFAQQKSTIEINKELVQKTESGDAKPQKGLKSLIR